MYNFTDDAWDDYLFWQKEDKRVLKRINLLIKDISRNPFDGIGKPELLKYNFQGAYSRRITEEHRLIYMVKDGSIYFLSFKDHYK